jgi:hypothetical protein
MMRYLRIPVMLTPIPAILTPLCPEGQTVGQSFLIYQKSGYKINIFFFSLILLSKLFYKK